MPDQPHLDAGTRKHCAIALADLEIGPALCPSRHHDHARWHGADDRDGYDDNRNHSHGDRDAGHERLADVCFSPLKRTSG